MSRIASALALIYLWISAADEQQDRPPSSMRMAVAGGLGYVVALATIAGLFYWATK